MDRFDKFTDDARAVLNASQSEARRFRHDYIGTEHLLLGLVAVKEGVAAIALTQLGVEATAVRTAVEFIIGTGEHPGVGEVGLTPRSKRVIELAIDEARRLDHRYIGTEHLLLGLLREGEGIAAGVLVSLGVNLDDARHTVIAILLASGAMPSARKIGETAAAIVPSMSPDRSFVRYDDWTPDARAAVIDAIAGAADGPRVVGTDHLLLGIVAAPDGAGTTLLATLGVAHRTVQSAISDARAAGRDDGDRSPSWETAAPDPGAGETLSVDATGDAHLELSSHVRMAFAMAEGEARRQGAAVVAVGHLLIGLTLLPTTIGGRALQHLGVTPPGVRTAMGVETDAG